MPGTRARRLATSRCRTGHQGRTGPRCSPPPCTCPPGSSPRTRPAPQASARPWTPGPPCTPRRTTCIRSPSSWRRGSWSRSWCTRPPCPPTRPRGSRTASRCTPSRGTCPRKSPGPAASPRTGNRAGSCRTRGCTSSRLSSPRNTCWCRRVRSAACPGRRTPRPARDRTGCPYAQSETGRGAAPGHSQTRCSSPAPRTPPHRMPPTGRQQSRCLRTPRASPARGAANTPSRHPARTTLSGRCTPVSI
mmetsp:Transcript_32182/g.76424  ORF Transcript_32182/g.76424 Transcript_32182/m.76424 type:complete len:247 (+) Transcript_32182:269-1009(+)